MMKYIILTITLMSVFTLTQSKPAGEMLDEALFEEQLKYDHCYDDDTGKKDCLCVCRGALNECMGKKQKGHKDYIPNVLFCVRNQMVCLQPHVCRPVELVKLKKWANQASSHLV